MTRVSPVVRPPALPGSGGLFAPEFFQIAYVTTDLAKAVAMLRERYAIRAFTTTINDLPDGAGKMKIALAWTGGVQIEVIEVQAEGTIYRANLPDEGFAVRHHHFGYFVADDAAWDAAQAARRAAGLEIAFDGDVAGFLRFFYVYLPEFDHYVEYIQPYAGGRAFFEGVTQG